MCVCACVRVCVGVGVGVGVCGVCEHARARMFVRFDSHSGFNKAEAALAHA